MKTNDCKESYTVIHVTFIPLFGQAVDAPLDSHFDIFAAVAGATSL